MRMVAFILAILSAAPCFAQSARSWTYVVPDRIAINGIQFLDTSRNAWLPTGYNDDIVTTVIPTDFQQMASPPYPATHPAKAVRITFGFLNNMYCQDAIYPGDTTKDFYDPNNPNGGYLDPTKWLNLVSAVNAAAANGIWVDLAVSGGNCAFFNSQTLLNQYYAMWKFVAQTFRKTPHIFDYEMLSEPHPSGPNNFTGYVDDGSTGCSATSNPSGVAGKVLCVQIAGGNVFLYAGNTGYPNGEPGNNLSAVGGSGIPSGVTIECDYNSPTMTCPSTYGHYTGGSILDVNGNYTPLGTYLLTSSAAFSTGATPISIQTTDGFNPAGKFDNTAVTGLCRTVFASPYIRLVDQQTILSCSPAKTGDSRAIANIAMPDQSNWAANFNFFELGSYVQQVNLNLPSPPPRRRYR